MSILTDQFPANVSHLHHAYLILGSADELWPVLADRLGVSGAGDPDLSVYRCDRLSIEDARGIREAQAQKPVRGERTVLVIEAAEITREAQNALLKVFEDPAPSTILFLVVPDRDRLLATLRSRLASLGGDGASQEMVDISAFLSAPPAERFSLMHDIIDAKDRSKARLLLDQLERALHSEHSRAGGVDRSVTEALREIIHIKRYVNDPGSSVKLLCEYIALRVPQIQTSQ